MRYIALLRGVNVGGKNRVEMKRLKDLLESSGYTRVRTYLNSGNLFFDATEDQPQLQQEIPELIAAEFGFVVPTLIKTAEDVERIAKAIPQGWKSDAEQKTDVAFLFPEIDYEEILGKFPVKREYIDLVYEKGAVIWNLKKNDYHKSQLNKIISRKIYKLMTLRNANTVRYLGGLR